MEVLGQSQTSVDSELILFAFMMIGQGSMDQTVLTANNPFIMISQTYARWPCDSELNKPVFLSLAGFDGSGGSVAAVQRHLPPVHAH